MKKECSCIALFVKPPVPGRVKTRLARDIGVEAACAVYRTLADRIVAAAVATGMPLCLCHDGYDETALPHEWRSAAHTLIPQQGDDLGERIAHAFSALFSTGYEQVALVGSDIPGLDSSYICDAFNLLKTNDLVIGPAVDGGYCLIGFHASTFTPVLFQEIPWSSDQVLTLTLAAAEAAGLSTGLLPPLRDIDTLADLHACCDILPTALHRKITREAIMESLESLLIQTINQAPDAIIISNREGIINFWNAGAEQILGYSSTEAVGQSLDLFIPEKLRGRHWEGYYRVMESGETKYKTGLLSSPGLRKDGSQVSLEFSMVLLKDESGVMQGCAAIMRDVTARWLKEKELKEKLAACEVGQQR